jgi:hypothetical protein
MGEVIDRLTAALADRYAIEREIGSGGMATVYLAHDRKRGCRCAMFVMLAAGVIGACNEPISGPPPPLEVLLQPAMIWGVGDVTLTSDGFRGFDLTPQQDSSGPVPRRWSNFAVQIDGDTVDTRRVDDTTMAASVPRLFTGVYGLRVSMPDREFAPAELEVVGLRYEYDVLYDGPDGRRTFLLGGGGELAVPPRGLVVFQHLGIVAPMVWLDLPKRDARVVPDRMWGGMWGPGPSYLRGHIVADVLGDDTGPVSLLLNGPAQPQISHSVPCRPPASQPLAVAEVGPGPTCIGWWDATFWANGSAAMAHRSGWHQLAFRMSAGGRRTVPIAEYCDLGPEEEAAWLVFDATPAVAYELEDVGCALGAAFSLDGDTLYVIAEDTTRDWRHRQRMVQVRDASDGRVIRSAVLATGRLELLDVLPDPVNPWLYVALNKDPGFSLLVLHRETLAQVALVRGSWLPYKGTLIWGGAWGVYFYGVYDAAGDFGRVWEFDLPARYPP